jgi:PDZ domain-containing protein
VTPGLPADGLVESGETIIGLDGQPIEVWEDVVGLMRAHRPGDTVEVEVEDEALERRTVHAEVISRCEAAAIEHDRLERLADEAEAAGEPAEPVPDLPECTAELEESAIFGVIGSTRDLEFDFPVDVSIDAGDVIGPSAGLAFTLAVLDVLTPGELTGGARVATTGTINLDGSIGPVGGVRQKTVAVREADIDVFLVPSVEYEQAAAEAGDDLTVVAVDTLDEALAALDELGGNALELTP